MMSFLHGVTVVIAAQMSFYALVYMSMMKIEPIPVLKNSETMSQVLFKSAVLLGGIISVGFVGIAGYHVIRLKSGYELVISLSALYMAFSNVFLMRRLHQTRTGS